MKKNIESIVTSDLDHCYIHKKYLRLLVRGEELHHMCHGTANREVANKEKITCMLCRKCHKLLHDQGYHDLDLQQDAERAWLEHNGKTIEDWIKLFGKNYL